MRQTGIEPVLQPWKGCILPLNYWRGDSLIQAVIVSIFTGFSSFSSFFVLHTSIYENLVKKMALPRFELGLPDSKSDVLTNYTIRPVGHCLTMPLGLEGELAVVSILLLCCNTMAY